MTQFLGVASTNVRQVAAQALGEIGDARTVDPLTKALQDDVIFIRTAAEDALKRIEEK